LQIQWGLVNQKICPDKTPKIPDRFCPDNESPNYVGVSLSGIPDNETPTMILMEWSKNRNCSELFFQIGGEKMVKMKW